jgi:DNA-binding transcriptional LysR family regulator
VWSEQRRIFADPCARHKPAGAHLIDATIAPNARAPGMDVDSFLFFAAVVDAGSFVNAARKLGMDRSNVSRRIARLERDMGEQLLVRTTRRMRLTEMGQVFYERCAVIAAEVEEARKAVRSLRSAVRGRLHVSCPPMAGRMYFAPLFREFCRRHPDVELRVTMKNDVVDLIVDGVDIALRVTDGPGPTMVARELAAVRWILCATPGYLQAHGTPRVPEDLARHAWLGVRGRMELGFAKGSEHRRVMVTARLQCSDYAFLREAALEGLGIGLVPSYAANDEIRSGKLRPVLEDYSLAPSPGGRLYAITLPSRYVPTQVRALLDFLKESFHPRSPWDATGAPGERATASASPAAPTGGTGAR